MVWNHGILWLSIYWEFHHPNWRTQIFQRGSNHQPDEYWRMSPVPTSRFESLHAETSHSNIVLEFWQLCPDLYRTDFYESTGSESERVITPHIYIWNKPIKGTYWLEWTTKYDDPASIGILPLEMMDQLLNGIWIDTVYQRNRRKDQPKSDYH